MNILTFIFFLFLGFYLLQWVVRLWFRRRLRKLQQQMENGGGQGYYKQYTWGRGTSAQRERHQTREGEIKVETGAAPGKKVNDRIGDYVEYEEVEIGEENRPAK